MGLLPTLLGQPDNVGNGHVTLIPFMPDSIGQGTWGMTQNTDRILNGFLQNNGSHANGDNCSFKVYLTKGTYTFKTLHDTSYNRGIMNIKVNGVIVEAIDTYSAGGVVNVIATQTGIIIPTSGIKNIMIECGGKNGASSNYYLELIMIQMYRTT